MLTIEPPRLRIMAGIDRLHAEERPDLVHLDESHVLLERVSWVSVAEVEDAGVVDEDVDLAELLSASPTQPRSSSSSLRTSWCR